MEHQETVRETAVPNVAVRTLVTAAVAVIGAMAAIAELLSRRR